MELLLELATMSYEATDDASQLTSVACSCLIALVIARGDTGKLLSALAALLMCPQLLAVQPIHVIYKNIFEIVFRLNVYVLHKQFFFYLFILIQTSVYFFSILVLLVKTVVCMAYSSFRS